MGLVFEAQQALGVSMKALALVVALIAGTSAAAGEFRVWGHSEQDSHFLSAAELIGSPTEFDGQPVSAVGFVQFRDKRQPVFRLYATRDDLENSIPAAVKIGEFSEALKISDSDLASLDGRVVMIEGTFRMYERGNLKPGEPRKTVCAGDCGVPGEIVDIVLITTWPPR